MAKTQSRGKSNIIHVTVNCNSAKMIMPYGSECWALSKAGTRRIDEVDQWYLQRILDGTTLSEMPTSVALPNQPPLSSIINSRRLTFIGHLARMDDNAGIYEPPPENWRRPPGRPRTTWIKNIHDDLSSLNLGIHEARDLTVHVTITQL